MEKQANKQKAHNATLSWRQAVRFGFKGTNGPTVWKTVYRTESSWTGAAEAHTDVRQMNLNTKSVVKDEEGCLMMKGPTRQEGITARVQIRGTKLKEEGRVSRVLETPRPHLARGYSKQTQAQQGDRRSEPRHKPARPAGREHTLRSP